jgi:hypothetical protein
MQAFMHRHGMVYMHSSKCLAKGTIASNPISKTDAPIATEEIPGM